MEQLPERTEAPSRITVARDRPAPLSKVERMTEETKGLVGDLTSWVELRLKLTQLEVEERVEARLNDLIIKVIIGVVAGIAGLFALITLALAIGAWLGHPAWGFLVVTVLLLLVAGALRAAQPHLVSLGDKRARVKEKKLASNGSTAQ